MAQVGQAINHISWVLTEKFEPGVIKFLGKNILSLKDSENNEFVNGELDPDRIDEYVYSWFQLTFDVNILREILLEYEKMAIEEKNFKGSFINSSNTDSSTFRCWSSFF